MYGAEAGFYKDESGYVVGLAPRVFIEATIPSGANGVIRGEYSAYETEIGSTAQSTVLDYFLNRSRS